MSKCKHKFHENQCVLCGKDIRNMTKKVYHHMDYFRIDKNGQRVVCDPITVWCDECAEIRENKREESK